MRKIMILFVLSIPLVGFSQRLTDSAEMMQAGFSYENIEDSIAFWGNRLNLVRQSKESDSLLVLYKLGYYYKEAGKFDSALKCLSSAKNICMRKAIDDVFLVRVYMEIASLYGRMRFFDSAFFYSEKACEIEQSINGKESELYATIAMNSGLYKFTSGDTLQGLSIIREVYNSEYGNKQHLAFNLGGIYSAIGDADSCYKYIAEAWDIAKTSILSELKRLPKEDRRKYITTEAVYEVITSPINYFLQHEKHSGLKRLSYESILFYKALNKSNSLKSDAFVYNNLTAKSIASFLGEGEASVEIWSDLSGSWYSNHILAFIMKSGETDPIFVKLSKDSIYMAVNNELATTKTFLPLYETIWKRIIKSINLLPHGTIYISNDEILSQIPIEIICNYNWDYIGDIYNIVRVSYSGNIPNIRNKTSLNDMFLFGGLQYNYSSIKIRMDDTTRNDEMFVQNTSAKTDDYAALRTGVKYLPWTKIEVDSIKNIWSPIGKVSVFSNDRGTRESFLAMDGDSPSILHIATHGYHFQPTTKMSWHDYFNFCMDNSALLFSCANNKDMKDCLVNAYDINNMDLSKTSLLVLAACKTGIGGISPFGSVGLQNAFKRAGVGTIIMTLDNVSDAATYAFMLLLYKYLSNGLGKRQAFKRAQSDLRKNELFSQFNYWSSFVMVD